MKKLAVAILIIGAFFYYSLVHDQSAGTALAPNPSTTSTTTGTAPANTSTAGSSGTGSSNTGGTSTSTSPSASSSASGQFKDGSYTGSVADAQWGYIQVKAVVTGSKLTDVQFLQYPNERDRSVQINTYADPILTQEAIQAQSAQVDIVSGATDSSEAFMQSLGDALTQAQG